jgi:anti-sigma factor RsiW
MCYNTGSLQAHLDGEIKGNEKSGMEEHLRTCKSCREQLELLRENQVFASGMLAGYMSSLGQKEVDTGAAWNRFKGEYTLRQEAKKHSGNKKKGVLTMLSRYRVAATAAVLVLALAFSFSFGVVRTAASELLTIFRVEKVQTVSITPEDMAIIEKAMYEGTGAVDVDNFGKFEFNGNQETEKATMDEAKGAVDFPVKLPAGITGYSGPEIYLNAGGTMTLTLDTVNINKMIQSFGSDKLLPDDLNGKTFTVNLPAQVTAKYKGLDNNMIIVGQSRSPELIAPGSDVLVIRDALLALPFLPNNLRSQLASIDDWQHTIIVPNVDGSSQEVKVNGAEGVFISQPEGSETDDISCLIWQKDGVVYAVSGRLTMEQALDTASTMR